MSADGDTRAPAARASQRALGLPARALAWPAALVGISAAVLSPGLLAGPSLDASVFALAGAGILRGEVPYRDVWDHKPPMVYLVDAAAQAVMPFLSAWATTWVVSVLFLALTGWLVQRLVLLADGRGGSRLLALVVVAAAGVYPVALGGGMSETYATPLAGLALVLLLDPRPRPWRDVAAGALLAAAVLTSLQLVPALLAAAILVIARRAIARIVAGGVAVAAGGIGVAGAVAAWLLASGATPSAYDALVTYQQAYVRLSWSHTPDSRIPLLIVALALLGLLVPLVTIGPRGIVARVLASPFTQACAAWLTVAILLVAVQRRLEPHYAISIVIPLAVLVAPALAGALKSGPETVHRVSWRRLSALTSVELALVATAMWTYAGTQGSGLSGANVEADRAMAAWIDARTPSSATVFAWGNEPSLLLAADRRPASRYVYTYPLTTPGYSSPAQIDDLVSSLAADPPAVIVDASSSANGTGGFVPLLAPHPTSIADGRDLDVADPLRQFVRERYRLVDVIAGWPVYVPKP